MANEIDMSELEDLTQRFAGLPDPLVLDLSQVEFIDCFVSPSSSSSGAAETEASRSGSLPPHPPSIASWPSPG